MPEKRRSSAGSGRARAPGDDRRTTGRGAMLEAQSDGRGREPRRGPSSPEQRPETGLVSGLARVTCAVQRWGGAVGSPPKAQSAALRSGAGGLEGEARSGAGVIEAQPLRVQASARDPGGAHGRGCRRGGPPPRAARGAEVDADLVAATGADRASEQGVPPELLQHLDLGHVLAVGVVHHLSIGLPWDGPREHPLEAPLRAAGHEREVAFAHGVGAELVLEDLRSPRCGRRRARRWCPGRGDGRPAGPRRGGQRPWEASK